jgi:hypothetical protein
LLKQKVANPDLKERFWRQLTKNKNCCVVAYFRSLKILPELFLYVRPKNLGSGSRISEAFEYITGS